LAKFSGGWLPVHQPHKIGGKKKEKKEYLAKFGDILEK
jgi:hypothetical protein